MAKTLGTPPDTRTAGHKTEADRLFTVGANYLIEPGASLPTLLDDAGCFLGGATDILRAEETMDERFWSCLYLVQMARGIIESMRLRVSELEARHG